MEQQIIKKIFESCESGLKDLQKTKNIDKIIENFPVLDDDEVGALATSFSKLLSYKVSPEAHQRYATRIQVIELLREWVRPPLGFDVHPTFLQDSNMLEFIHDLMKKYMTPQILHHSDTSSDNLIKLGKLLLNLSKRNPTYVPQLKTLVERITLLHQSCDEKTEFVEAVLNSKTELGLDAVLIDQLYLSIAEKVLEIPLIDNFLLNCEKLKNKEELLNSKEFDQVIDLIAFSPKLFQTASAILKELFLHCFHSLLVVEYIQFVLKNVLSRRDEKLSILELYPAHLQACVALLQIDSRLPRHDSKKYILNSLSDVYLRNKDEIFILMLHYPGWLDELANYIGDFV